MKDIAVLLPTFNGEKYIGEMLDSLLNSKYFNGSSIYIRDDGSTDDTISVLKAYKSRHPEKIVLYTGENIGPVMGYNFLLGKALDHGYSYILFADQDDIWAEEKIGLVSERLSRSNVDIPYLVHSDLFVVDQQLKLIDSSYWHYQYLNPQKNNLNRLLLQNVVTGCTMGINRKLAELSYPIPREAIMHDWWLALVASAFGKIEVIPEPLVYYRQHGANTIGAIKFSMQFSKFKEPLFLANHIQQAAAFYIRYNKVLDSKQRSIIQAFLKLLLIGRVQATFLIIRYSLYKNGLMRNIGMILKVWIKK